MKKLVFLMSFLILLVGSVNAADEKLTFVFQKQKDPTKVKTEADLLAGNLAKILNSEVETKVPNDYASAVQALVSKKADIAYLDSVSYLLAKRDGNAEVLLAEVRQDAKGAARTDYDSLILVPKDSPLQTIDDLVKNAKETRFVFTSPTSTSGYIMAYRRFVKEDLVKPETDVKEYFKSVSFAGSYALAMQQVIAGRGDACAVSFYAFEGDSAQKYLKQEELSQLRVLARTSGVPTHVIAVRNGFTNEEKNQIKSALIEVSKNSPELLTDLYGTASFEEVDAEKHLQATMEAVKYLNLPINNFVKSKKS